MKSSCPPLVLEVNIHLAVDQEGEQKVQSFLFPLLLHDDMNQGIPRQVIDCVDIDVFLDQLKEILCDKNKLIFYTKNSHDCKSGTVGVQVVK